MENVPSWNQACENMSIPSEIIVLETAIHQHQNLYESMCQAYTEVSFPFEESYEIFNIVLFFCSSGYKTK